MVLDCGGCNMARLRASLKRQRLARGRVKPDANARAQVESLLIRARRSAKVNRKLKRSTHNRCAQPHRAVEVQADRPAPAVVVDQPEELFLAVAQAVAQAVVVVVSQAVDPLAVAAFQEVVQAAEVSRAVVPRVDRAVPEVDHPQRMLMVSDRLGLFEIPFTCTTLAF